MNEHDSLEQELAALQPPPVTPHLRQRIAERLASSEIAVARKQRRAAPWLAGLTLVAASVALFLFLRPHQPKLTKNLPRASPPVSVTSVWDDTSPSVWNYHRAIRASSDVEAALEKYSSISPASAEPTRRQVFIGLNSSSLTNGEL